MDAAPNLRPEPLLHWGIAEMVKHGGPVGPIIDEIGLI
jgi:hypothetical protein